MNRDFYHIVSSLSSRHELEYKIKIERVLGFGAQPLGSSYGQQPIENVRQAAFEIRKQGTFYFLNSNYSYTQSNFLIGLSLMFIVLKFRTSQECKILANVVTTTMADRRTLIRSQKPSTKSSFMKLVGRNAIIR